MIKELWYVGHKRFACWFTCFDSVFLRRFSQTTWEGSTWFRKDYLNMWYSPRMNSACMKGKKTKGVILWQEHLLAPHSFWGFLCVWLHSGISLVLKDVVLCQVRPSLLTLITISWLPERDREGREWGIHSKTRGLCPIIWRQAEIAEPCHLTTVYSMREANVAVQQYLLHHWLHVGGPPPPRWNTIAEPDTAHSHTVLPHWKSHKTRVIQGSQATFSFLTGYHTCLGVLTFSLF